MIVFKIQEGLGNQLFQWATGQALSLKFNTKVYYDIGFFQNRQGFDHRVDRRDYCLPNILENDVPLLNQEVVNEFNSKPQQIIYEPDSFLDFDFDNKFSYFFVGYWQNEMYFKEYRKEIVSGIKKCFNPNFNFESSCSLHVRRGDFLNLLYKHPVQPYEYYEKALEEINPSGNIFVFSDDIEWCKANLKFKNLIFMDGNSNIEDLLLMSMCKDNIIANSSFSWWAAWLNANKEKRVIAPKLWYQDGTSDDNLIPDEWNRI